MDGPFCEKVDSIDSLYSVIEDIGAGAYGSVQKCLEKASNKTIALKKIKQFKADDAFPPNTIREVALLQKLKHENIIKLRKVLYCSGDSTVYLVFDFCEYDLSALLYHHKNASLSHAFIKTMIIQFLLVLEFLDTNNVAHRDLKPSNMLITRNNILKLADFGLAREIIENAHLSDKVITQWYRPPELFLGARKYGTEVDIWSTGCIIYELIASPVYRKPLFQSPTNNDIEQLKRIFLVCGTPSDDWKGWLSLPNAQIASSILPQDPQIRKYFDERIDPEFRDLIPLLNQMLVLDPSKRIKASAALQDPSILKICQSYDPWKMNPLSIPEIHELRNNQNKDPRKNVE